MQRNCRDWTRSSGTWKNSASRLPGNIFRPGRGLLCAGRHQAHIRFYRAPVSFGSSFHTRSQYGILFVRRFLTICGEQVDGAIIMGTGDKPAVVLKLGTMVVRRAIKKEGRDYHNETPHRLVLGSYNKPFEPGKRSMTGCPGTLRKTENTRRIRIAVLSFPMELMRISFR